MPPASLARLNAVSMPSFIWRPSSLADPENGAETPNRISVSVIPRAAAMLVAADIGGSRPVADWAEGRVATARSGTGGAAAGGGTCGSVAARADGGEKTPLTVGADNGEAPVMAGADGGEARVAGRVRAGVV